MKTLSFFHHQQWKKSEKWRSDKQELVFFTSVTTRNNNDCGKPAFFNLLCPMFSFSRLNAENLAALVENRSIGIN